MANAWSLGGRSSFLTTARLGGEKSRKGRKTGRLEYYVIASRKKRRGMAVDSWDLSEWRKKNNFEKGREDDNGGKREGEKPGKEDESQDLMTGGGGNHSEGKVS